MMIPHFELHERSDEYLPLKTRYVIQNNWFKKKKFLVKLLLNLQKTFNAKII